MIVEFAHFLSILAAAVFIFNSIVSLFFVNKSHHLSAIIQRSFNQAFYLLLISFLIFVYLAITDNFSVKYIAQHSNTNLPNFYKVSSIWSAHEGSMFLWILFIGIWGYLFNVFTDQKQELKDKSLGIISLVIFGFLIFLLITSNPFERIFPFPPENGADINPVLQDPALAIHPPTLYMGYVGFIIAFAHSIAFLLEGKETILWEKIVLYWSYGAWFFLTLGITLGSWWAYYELGWGGYWFWDPVENIALMPWLAATAFIHSIAVSSKTKLLRSWTIFLANAVFSLSLFGAFIVRSGIIDSIHSFANDPERGLYLLSYCALIILLSTIIFISRSGFIDKVRKISINSKESFISLNNIIFSVLIFTIFLGILYPLIFEYFSNQKISIGAPFYNAIFVPITLLAVFLMSLSVNARWGRASSLNIFSYPYIISFALSLLILLPIYILSIINSFYVYLSMFLGSLIIFRYIILIIKNRQDNKKTNFKSVASHLGLAMLIISIGLNSELSSEKTFSMSINDKVDFNSYEVNFNNLSDSAGSNYDAIVASIEFTDKKKTFVLNPEKRKFFVRGQITNETDIKILPHKDIYISLGEQTKDGRWLINIQENYFIRWIWLSAALMILSSIFAIFEKRRA